MTTKADRGTTSTGQPRTGKLKEFTRTQKRLLRRVVEEWAEVSYSTERADRETSEAGIALLYEAAGFDPPEVIWALSPRDGFLKYREAGESIDYLIVGGLGRMAVEGGRDRRGPCHYIDREIERRVSKQLSHDVWSYVSSNLCLDHEYAIGNVMDVASRRYIGYRPWKRARTHWIPVLKWATIGGPSVGLATGPGLTSVAEYDFFARIGAIRARKNVDAVHGYIAVKRSCAWWWPLETKAILLERPTEIHLDEDGELHRDEGKAIVFPTGWGLEYTHGYTPEKFTRESFVKKG